jgi:hypothetical protein
MTPTSGMIIPIDGIASPVIFQWNPKDVVGFDAHPEWSTLFVAGRGSPYLQYSNGKEQILKITIEASRYDNGDGYVAGFYESLISLTKPTITTGVMKRPPRVMLVLGAFLREMCIITEVSPRFNELFAPETLLPFHGEFSVTFVRYE